MRFVALWLTGIIIAGFILQSIIGTDQVVLVNDLKFSEPWRLVTSIFAHGGPAHLINNIIALSLFGLILEGRIGPKRVLWLFLLAGIAVNILSPYDRSLGASGAIYAILGALIVLRPKLVVWTHFMPMPMIVALFVWAAGDVLGIFAPSGTANIAHLGGLFVGVVAGIYYRRQFREHKGREENVHVDEDKVKEWEKSF